MSLTFQCGGTGSGKSYRTVEKHIIPELVEGRRVVITNLPLKLPELAEFLAREYPETFVDLRKRLVMLDDDDLAEFYRFRPYGYMVPPLSKEAEKKGERLDFMHCVREDKSLDLVRADFCNAERFLPEDGSIPDVVSSKALPGVLYVLDEIHTAYAAKDWQLHGNAVLFYLTQRRKFGGFADKVVCITQYPEQVMTDFRRHCQDWRYTTNHGKSPVTFGVKRPELMTEMRYLDIKRFGSSPIGMAKFKVDPEGIGSVYDTDAGVGIGGGGTADREDKPKGLPWWTWIVLLVAGGVVLFFVPNLFSYGVKKVADPTGGVSVAPAPKNAMAGQAAQPATPSASASGKPAVDIAAKLDPLPLVALGYALDGANYRIYLSNGRTLTRADRDVEDVDLLKGVKLGGEWVPWAKPQQSAPRQSQGDVRLDATPPVAPAPAGNAQTSSVLANPDASSSITRTVVVRSFDGKIHAVRKIRVEAESVDSQHENQ